MGRCRSAPLPGVREGVLLLGARDTLRAFVRFNSYVLESLNRIGCEWNVAGVGNKGMARGQDATARNEREKMGSSC